MNANIKKIIRYTGIIILFLFTAELLLHFMFFLLFSRSPKDPRVASFGYDNQPWAIQLFLDSQRYFTGNVKYQNYVLWKEHEFSSPSINVDAQGNRKTYNPDFLPASSTKIFFFGGSTMFGVGARDEKTIPSQFSLLINSISPRYEVTNYGTQGFVIGQEIKLLEEQLIAGKRPDYVVFYDGDNDIIASYDAGRAGAWSNEEYLRKKFEASPADRLASIIKDVSTNQCLLCRAAISIARKITGSPLTQQENAGAAMNDSQLDSLAASVEQDYASRLNIIDALSRQYGFRYMVFLQPSLFTEKGYVGDEGKLPSIDWRLRDEHIRKFFILAHEKFSLLHEDGFANIADAFNNRVKAIYIDEVHTNEEGNAIIANRIFDEITRRYPELKK